MSRAYYCTVEELNERGRDNIPDQFRSNMHLIYSSPATLAFNSPGAEGFGVKRAGLAVPDSIMLIVAPGCCGRNTSLISSMREYDNRFFYLMMDETDIVTGRHLKKIPKAVEEICNSLDKKPSVVMICITCVDALLGTDMERVCRKAEEKTGLPVRPCYMYALTREGRKPPMVHVRQSLYSLLEPTKKKGNVVNLLGFFSPLVDDCELYDLLHSAGIKTIHEISRCRDFEEYKTMSEANFNLVLHQESRFAAEDFNDRLKIPFIELRRLYQTDKIQNQYQALASVLGVSFELDKYREAAEQAIEDFRKVCPDASFAVGECMNGDPFELALALLKYGFKVPEIYGTIAKRQNGELYTTGAQRTGCSMCGFGIHLEQRPHRFDKLRERNPKEWEFWMYRCCTDPNTGEKYGWGRVLDYIGVEWEDIPTVQMSLEDFLK